MFTKLRELHNKAFCWLYDKWLKHAVDDKADPLVRLMDWLIGSQCKYCMAVRAFLLGVSMCASTFTGLFLTVLVLWMTWGEKHLLCQTSKK